MHVDPPNPPVSNTSAERCLCTVSLRSNAVKTGLPMCTCAMINHIGMAVSETFKKHLSESLQAGLRSRIDLSRLLSNRSTEPEQQKISSLVVLNNLDLSVDFLGRLVSDLSSDIKRAFGASHEAHKIESAVHDLAATANELRQVLAVGIDQLVAANVASKIKSLVDGMEVSYELTQQDIDAFDKQSAAMTTIIAGIGSMLEEFKGALSRNNHDAFVGSLAVCVAKVLEGRIFHQGFNALGAIQFDRDIRSLSAFLSANTSWSVRDRFARLQQLCTVLNLGRVRLNCLSEKVCSAFGNLRGASNSCSPLVCWLLWCVTSGGGDS